MNNLVALKIQLPSRKKRIGKRAFGKKLRKVAPAWQVSDENHRNTIAKSVTSHKNKMSLSDTSRKKSPKEGFFRPLDDVARKLLDMSTTVTVENQPDLDVAGGSDLEEVNQVPSGDKASSNVKSQSPNAQNKHLKDLTYIETITDGGDSNSMRARGNDLQEEEASIEDIAEEEGAYSAGRSEDVETLEDNDKTIFFIGDDGNPHSLHAVKLDSWQEANSAVDPELPEDNYSTFDRYNFKRRFSPHSHARRKYLDTKPVVVVVANEAAPRHYLLPERSPSGGSSASIPFPYREISRKKQPLEDCLRNVFLRKAVSRFRCCEKNTPTEIARPYIFHVFPDNKVLLGLKYPHALFFRGKLSVTVLLGTLEVLGYEMSSDELRKTLAIYSPRGTSLLSLRASETLCESINWDVICNRLGLDVSKINDILSEMNDIDCLLLVENIICPRVDFISDNFPLKLFPTRGILRKKRRHFHDAEEILHCKFVTPDTADNLKLYTKQADWETCIETMTKNGKIRAVVCGGKSVGKSTFLRFLVNKHLAKFKEVLYLDCDPGQSEFTIPGCISAVVVKEAVLGPNYSHLLTPHRMVYVGEINMSRCPARYLQCVQHAIEYCHSQPQFSDIPWFINTMGFNKGLGVELTVNVIRMVGPSDVVQIQSSQKNRNFPQLLEPLYVCDYQSTLSPIPSASYSDLVYNFHELPSAAEILHSEDISDWGMEAPKLRDLVILAYLSQMLMSSQRSLTEVIPFRLPFSKLKLCVCHEAVQYSQYLTAMNCNLVALCSVGDEDILVPSNPEYPRILLKLPVCPCFGFGIVRGIDLEAKEVHLISPLSEKELSQVNCLVLGPVTLPAGLLLRTNSVTGQIPYVTAGAGQPTGQNLRKSRSVAQLHKKRKHPE